MEQQTAVKDITDLLGKPEDNPNFKPGEIFDTGYYVAFNGSILNPNNERTNYFVDEIFGKLFNPDLLVIGILGGLHRDIILTSDCKKTGYFLGGLHKDRILYSANK